MADEDDKVSAEQGSVGSSAAGNRGDWREDLAQVASHVMGEDQFGRLLERLDDVGRVGDLVIAAHLDDVLFVERARYQRARREVGRARALGRKDDVAAAQDRLRAVAASLGVVRLQRDLATGDVQVPLDDDHQPDKGSAAN